MALPSLNFQQSWNKTKELNLGYMLEIPHLKKKVFEFSYYEMKSYDKNFELYIYIHIHKL